jgi:CBS domain-containing protein
LILIGEDQLIERALQRINSHNVHSIPVISKGAIIGCVDVLNIVSSLIHAIESGTSQVMQQNIRREFMTKQVNTLISKCHAISSSASILSACEKMVKLGESRFVVARRSIEGDITELKSETDVVGIFTLSDVLKFLVQNSMMMKETPVFNKTLRELGLGRNSPKCVNSKSSVSDAFKEISRLCCNGLAIVDDGGQLVGNLSASDLKGVTRRNCAILNSSVENFLSRDLKRPWWNRPISIDLNDTLYHTVQQFVSLNIHRMYVVEHGKPIGEITHQDVLDQLWKSFQHS